MKLLILLCLINFRTFYCASDDEDDDDDDDSQGGGEVDEDYNGGDGDEEAEGGEGEGEGGEGDEQNRTIDVTGSSEILNKNELVDFSYFFSMEEPLYAVEEGGILNISFFPISVEYDFEELKLVQAGMYSSEQKICFILNHKTQFFSAALLSELYLHYFKFLDAGFRYITLFDFSLEASGLFYPIFNIHYEYDLGFLKSENKLTVYPNFDKWSYSNFNAKYGVTLNNDIKMEFSAGKVVIFMQKYGEYSHARKFYYIYDDHTYFSKSDHPSEELTQKEFRLDNFEVTYTTETMTVTYNTTVFPFQIGVEIERVKDFNTVSTSGYILPEDFPKITVQGEESVAYDIERNGGIQSFDIYLGDPVTLCVEKIGTCIIAEDESCVRAETIRFNILQLTPTTMMVENSQKRTLYIRFSVSLMLGNNILKKVTKWRSIFGSEVQKVVVVQEDVDMSGTTEMVITCDPKGEVLPVRAISKPPKVKTTPSTIVTSTTPETAVPKRVSLGGKLKIEPKSYKDISLILAFVVLPLIVISTIAFIAFGYLIRKKKKYQVNLKIEKEKTVNE